MQGEDPEETISNSGNHHPFIIVVGEDHLHPNQFLIIVENNKLLEVGSFTKAMVALVSAYYIFDIVYAKPCTNTLLFIEKFLFELECSSKLSPSCVAAISSMEKM